MTAAQITAAAKLLDGLDPQNIVTLCELGSEGAVFYIGTFMNRGPRYLIARDGSVSKEPDERRIPTGGLGLHEEDK